MMLKCKPEDFIVREVYDVPMPGGNYTYFVLKKKNYTTERAIQAISKKVNIPRRNFGYAGTKDKHAITIQLCSVKGNISDMVLKDIEVKIVGKGKEPISLGDLVGNEFEITVRDIEKKPEPVTWIMNYFDEQRFSENNVEVGRCMIKGDFQKAAKLIRHRSVQSHIEDFPNDHVGAIKTLPFKIQKIYIAAYQSYLWNECVASYVRKNYPRYLTIKYSQGEFLFPNTRPEFDVPLISFDSDVGFYEEILKKEGLALRDFVIRQMPDLTPQGSSRHVSVEVKDLHIRELENKKIKIKFFLPKGSYATLAVKRMLA